MHYRFAACVFFTCYLASVASSVEHRVEVLDGGPKKAELAKEMREQFAERGFKVIRGSSRTVCEIWPCKTWEIQPDFEPSASRLYPFESGQLIGLLHFQRRGKDFRDQTIESGWYTLRFGLQPTDGNHVGTSPTRDFLLLLPADEDKSPDPVGVTRLTLASAESAGSAHPAMLCLQPPSKKASKEPSMRHNEERDWWVLQFSGKASEKGKTKEFPVDLIVVGHADE